MIRAKGFFSTVEYDPEPLWTVTTTTRRPPRPSYRPNPQVDDIPDRKPDELTLLIQAHASPYPEDDPRRVWIAKALRQWAGNPASEG